MFIKVSLKISFLHPFPLMFLKLSINEQKLSKFYAEWMLKNFCIPQLSPQIRLWMYYNIRMRIWKFLFWHFWNFCRTIQFNFEHVQSLFLCFIIPDPEGTKKFHTSLTNRISSSAISCDCSELIQLELKYSIFQPRAVFCAVI